MAQKLTRLRGGGPPSGFGGGARAALSELSGAEMAQESDSEEKEEEEDELEPAVGDPMGGDEIRVADGLSWVAEEEDEPQRDMVCVVRA